VSRLAGIPVRWALGGVGISLEEIDLALAPEGLPPGEEEVESAPERVDVGSVVDPPTPGLFRGDVVRCAVDALLVVVLAFRLPELAHLDRQAEVDQLDPVAVVEEEVRGLHIPMDQTDLLGRSQAPGGLDRDVDGDGDGERAAPAHPILGRPALHVLHGEERWLTPLTGVDRVDLCDVGVAHRGDGPGLTEEEAVVGLVPLVAGVDALDRDPAVELWIMGPVDDAHSPLPDLLLEAERSQGRPTRGAHRTGLVVPLTGGSQEDLPVGVLGQVVGHRWAFPAGFGWRPLPRGASRQREVT
jgi:hypothetical protein